MQTISLIVLAICIHYAIEYFEEANKIECPSYCEVDHQHIKLETKVYGN